MVSLFCTRAVVWSWSRGEGKRALRHLSMQEPPRCWTRQGVPVGWLAGLFPVCTAAPPIASSEEEKRWQSQQHWVPPNTGGLQDCSQEILGTAQRSPSDHRVGSCHTTPYAHKRKSKRRGGLNSSPPSSPPLP